MKRPIILLALVMTAGVTMARIPQVVAHRGYHRAAGSAQNSIRALVKADSIGCEKTEFDVWISADNVLYVNHNPEITGIEIETNESKILDTRKLANGERLPRLETFLDTAATLGVNLVLELKPHRDKAREDVAVPMIIKMIADRGLTDRTEYITFSRHAFDLLVAQSGRPVSYLSAMAPEELKAAGGAGADYNISVYRSNPDWISQLHALGMPVNIWTVDKPADLQWCIDHGVDMVTTNEPELAQKMIAERYAPRDLRIMSYNLRAGTMANMDELADAINAFHPDFVALQEVDVNTYRNNAKATGNNGRNFVNELAQRTGMFGYYGHTIDLPAPKTVRDSLDALIASGTAVDALPGMGNYYGIALLSKHPADKIESIELPNPANAEPRVLLLGNFRLDGKLPLRFGCTHFDYTKPETIERQAQYIADKINPPTASAYVENIPAIVAGDLNTEPDSKAFKILMQYARQLSGSTPTFPSDAPQQRLDHILGFPQSNFDLVETTEGAVVANPLSDHLPIYSIVRFYPAK